MLSSGGVLAFALLPIRLQRWGHPFVSIRPADFRGLDERMHEPDGEDRGREATTPAEPDYLRRAGFFTNCIGQWSDAPALSAELSSWRCGNTGKTRIRSRQLLSDKPLIYLVSGVGIEPTTS